MRSVMFASNTGPRPSWDFWSASTGRSSEEEIYWRVYDSPAHARECIEEFRLRYNEHRPHWALVPEGGGEPHTPAEVYTNRHRTQVPRWQPWARKAKGKLDQWLNGAAAGGIIG